MANIRTITLLPAKILKEKLKPLTEAEIKSEKIQKLIEDMRESMIVANGVGLSANQVNENLQLFVIDKKLAEEHGVPDVFINPEITEYSREKDEMEEGCLSIPEYFVPIPRSKKVKVRALGPDGKKLKFKARGFLSRVLQHEYDHLNGLLIKDRQSK